MAAAEGVWEALQLSGAAAPAASNLFVPGGLTLMLARMVPRARVKRRAKSEWTKGGGGRAARTGSLLAPLPVGACLPACLTDADRAHWTCW